jgi:phosphoribosylanthranilate isomerase
MVRVKICGITSLDDALVAVDAGADALGFVFYPQSPRAVTPKTAGDIVARLPAFVLAVGVFVNVDLAAVRQNMSDCGLQLAQLHGNESPAYCAELGRLAVKAIRVRDHRDLATMSAYHVGAFLLDAFVPDTPGGTGTPIDWELAVDAKPFGPIILAGGLTPNNVGEAVRRVRPYGVDVSSGVELSPGKKDGAKVRAFIANAKASGRDGGTSGVGD